MDKQRLEKLLDRFVDGALTPDEKAELERMLLSSPQARQIFWEHARFNALVRRLGEEEWGRPVDVLVMPDGALLVSDDRAGAIYRITYKT